uniref:CREG-like beta-barrel domain-containing protein n=2 Tax=Dendroctonus ponderosae TaxID=77166 RepID=J3JU95_DENPD|nr:unknown [Dendroctonus ponderosae]
MKSAFVLVALAIYWQKAISIEAGLVRNTISELPPLDQYALMARYIIHKSDWLSIATISTRNNTKGFPFVSLKSVSDGNTSSTGVPYLYLTDMDVTGQDVLENDKVTIMASLAQSDYCTTKGYDPQDPRCAKVMISGTVEKLANTTEEFFVGQKALFDRHPEMKKWPDNHGFYVAKVNPSDILVLDHFGGAESVTVEDYFNANLTNIIDLDAYFRAVAVVIVMA